MTYPTLGQISDIDIRLLQVFRAVTEAGGISAAELELNIGRSTISRHIKDLEIRLGITLCQRGRAGFALTHEGKTVYDATLRLTGSLDKFRSEINDIHGKMTGQINLALFDKTVSNPECKLDDALKLFDDVAPNVELNLYVEPLNKIENGVLEGQFQIGVIPAHRTSSSLRYQILFNEAVSLYCAKDHPLFQRANDPISDDEIRRFRYAGLGYHSPNMQLGHQLELKRSATGYDQEAIAHLILSARYLGHLPNHYAHSFIQQNLIKAVNNPHFQYCCKFVAITRSSPKPSRVLSTFINCLMTAHKLPSKVES